jgi:hypothetical protein
MRIEPGYFRYFVVIAVVLAAAGAVWLARDDN